MAAQSCSSIEKLHSKLTWADRSFTVSQSLSFDLSVKIQLQTCIAFTENMK